MCLYNTDSCTLKIRWICFETLTKQNFDILCILQLCIKQKHTWHPALALWDFSKAFTNLFYLHIHVPIVVSMNIPGLFCFMYINSNQCLKHGKKRNKCVGHILLHLVLCFVYDVLIADAFGNNNQFVKNKIANA